MATMDAKSGLGKTPGVVSELSAFVTVNDGHQDELRAASQRVHERVSRAPRQAILTIGIRTMRHVLYDRGRRRPSLPKLRGGSLPGGCRDRVLARWPSLQAAWCLVFMQFARLAKEYGETR